MRSSLPLVLALSWFASAATARAQESTDVVDMTGDGAQFESPSPTSPATGEPAAASREASPAEDARLPEVTAPEGAIPPPIEPASPSDPDRIQRPNILSLSLLGFIGRFRLTYERMLHPRHGLFTEFLVGPDLIRGFDFPSFGGSLGYRFHWRGPGRGPFVGGTLAFEGADGTVPVLESFGETDTLEYRGRILRLSLVPHAGYRWLFDSGFCIALRAGLGVGFTWTSPDPGSEPGADDSLGGVGIAADGEASLGWAF